MVIKQNIIYRTNISSIVLDHTLKLSFVRSNVIYPVHCKLYALEVSNQRWCVASTNLMHEKIHNYWSLM